MEQLKELTLNPEQEKLLDDVRQAEINFVRRLKGQGGTILAEKLTGFNKVLIDRGIEPNRYLLWHVAIGSTPESMFDLEFDTPNHDIEKFVQEDLLAA